MALALGTSACRSPADCGAAPASLLGRWTYSASQMAPSTASLTGTLTLQAGCPSFQGALDGTQQDGLGNVTHVDGLVTGQLLDTASVVFDAFFGANGRRHLGAIAHDSIRGTWVDQASGSNGSFVAAKELMP
jgi:hypothetical protein